MTTDATLYTLALLTIGMSFVAVRYRNMLLTLGATTLWATLLSFVLAHTTAGTNWVTMFILGVVAFLTAFALISFFSRSKSETSFTDNIGGITSRDEKPPEPRRQTKGLMDISTDEYKLYIRARLRRRGRR